jgi:ectoine hydroxylase
VSTLLEEVVRHPRIVDVARQVLGSDVYLHQTRLNHRPGFDQDSPVRRGVGTPDATSLSLLVDRCGIASCKDAAGSVVFFDANVLHGSNSNITPYPRASLVVVFNSVENALEEPFAGLSPRPSHTANRDPSPI